MWTYIWAFSALLLGFCAFTFRNKYEDYRYKYRYSWQDLDNAVQENTQKLRAERAKIVKKLLSTLRNPHPEKIVIYQWYDLSEIYHHPVDPRTPHYESYGTGCDIYGDGRVFISETHNNIQQNVENVGKPKDIDHLSKFIRENVDLYWFYLEVYRYFLENNETHHSPISIESNDKFHPRSEGVPQPHMTWGTMLDKQKNLPIPSSVENSPSRASGDNNSIAWFNANGSPAYTDDGQLFTQNVYEKWVRQANAGQFKDKGINNAEEFDDWLKRIGLHQDDNMKQIIKQQTELNQLKEYEEWLYSQPDYLEFSDWLITALKNMGHSSKKFHTTLREMRKKCRYTEAQKLLSNAYELFHTQKSKRKSNNT